MEFKDLVSLYFERANAMQIFWNFYVTIVLGLIVFFGSVKPSRSTTRVAAILSVAFVVFACVNLKAILGVTQQRCVAASLVRSSHSDKATDQAAIAAIAKSLDPPTKGGVERLHISVDLLTLAAVWSLALRKRVD